MRGRALPFVCLTPGATLERRRFALRFIHPGNNLIGDSLTDIGLERELSDPELSAWLEMIAGEAIELWKLPGLELPPEQSNLPERIRRLWAAGILELDETLMPLVADYPFNGFCGGWQ